MEQLGASRAVVRSALARLDHDGLVIREYNHSARVRMVTEEEALELMQARSVLEGLAAREAAVRATDEDIAEITEILGEMHQLLKQGDLLNYARYNTRLHARIVTASQHAVAQDMIANLKAKLARFQFRSILGAGRPAQSVAEHAEVVQAITNRDPDEADAAMRRHLGSVARALTIVASNAPQQIFVKLTDE